MASMSRYLEKNLLEHVTNKKAFTSPKAFLALCTVVPTSASTGSTISEATYTGYARVEVPAASWNAAVEGAPSTIKNSAIVKFAACTAGSSTIVAVALCDALTLGNMLLWTAVTSFSISTVSTPAECAVEALEINFT